MPGVRSKHEDWLVLHCELSVITWHMVVSMYVTVGMYVLPLDGVPEQFQVVSEIPCQYRVRQAWRIMPRSPLVTRRRPITTETQ